MANTKVTGDLIASGTITADNLVSGTLDTLLNSYLTTNTYATQGYVTTAVNNLIAAAPASLDTLNELAAALNDDANFATTVTNSLATKLNLSGGTLTGNLSLQTSDDTRLSLSDTTDSSSITVRADFTNSIYSNKSLNIYTENADHISFSTNGQSSERVRIDSSGHVTIGDISSAPTGTVPLTIFKSGANANLAIQSGGGSGRKYELISNTAGDFIVYDVNSSTEKLNIVSGGNVGIGTTSPAEKLHVNGNIRLFSAGYPYIDIGVATNNYFRLINDNPNDTFLIQKNGSTLVTFTAGGSVGIGTTSPSAKLDVGFVSGGTSLLLRNGDISSGSGNDVQIKLGFNDSDDYAHFIRTRHNSSDYNNAIDFYTCTGAQNNSLTYGVRQNLSLVSGNVGIGTTTPTSGYKLDVTGSILSQVGSGNTSVVVATSNANGALNALQNVGLELATDSTNKRISFRNGTSTNMVILDGGNVGIGTTSPARKLHVEEATTYIGRFAYNANNYVDIKYDGFNVVGGDMVFQTIGSERMRINSIGNVNIGTTGPTNPARVNIETSGATQVETGLRLINPYGFASAGTGVQIIFAQDRSESEDFSMAVIRSSQSTGGTSDNGDLKFFTRGSGTLGERMRILSSGGITFNGDTAAANALDDYEEGNYTPVVYTTSGTPTYQYQEGYYTKIGRQVFGGGIIGITNSASLGGNIRISLPFTSRASTYGTAGVTFADGSGFTWPVTTSPNNSLVYTLYAVIYQNSSAMNMITPTPSAGYIDYTSSGVSNAWYVRFSFNYAV